MIKHISAGMLALGLLCAVGFITPAAAQAASLTEAQISAIISLLSSFGADPAVIVSVNANLHGQAGGGSSGGGSESAHPSCLALNYDLFSGTTDANTNGQVSQLQQFLGVNQTGYFGPLTEQAVQNWQSSHGVVSSGSPDTTGYGFVGTHTRGAMGCGGSSTTPTTYTSPSTNYTPPPTITTNPTTSTATTIFPSISQVTPQPVSTGSPLTVYLSSGGTEGSIILATADGSRFWSTGYGTSAAEPNGFATYNGSQLTFTVPSTIGGEGPNALSVIPITSGTYNLYVTSDVSVNNVVTSNIGKSNVLPIQITSYSTQSSGTTATPTISSITPNTATANTVVTINGTYLTGASSVQLYHSNGQLGVTIPASNLSVTPTSVSFTISGGIVGIGGSDTYKVNVVTPSGTSNAASLIITAPAPAISCNITASSPTVSPYSSAPGVLYVTPNTTSVTLTWTSQGANYLTSNISGDKYSTSGSLTLTGGLKDSNVYIMTAYDAAGGNAGCSTAVDIDYKG